MDTEKPCYVTKNKQKNKKKLHLVMMSDELVVEQHKYNLSGHFQQ